MNYKIITDEEELLKFIDWLPELENDEVYYVALLGRKKYSTELKKDKIQLKRFTSDKQYLFRKIKQLECELGAYTFDGKPIPVECLSLYITPNPRSQTKAARFLTKELINLCFSPYNGYNIQAEALTALQKNPSRTINMDFDFDNTTIEEMRPQIVEVINEDCLTFVQTHGGFHVLVNVDKMQGKYAKNYYNNISKLPNSDARGDGLLPVPGTFQGGFTPRMIK